MTGGGHEELDRLSDEALLARLTDGSERAFTALYRRHQGRIYRFAYGMTGSPAIAEEVTQEVFLAVLNGRCQYNGSRGALPAFLMGVARNQTLRLAGRDNRYVELAEGDEPGTSSDAALDLVRHQTIEAVRKAVLALPEVYREVIAMCDLEEMDYAAAAMALGCPVGTVRSRLHRARAMLAEKLAAADVSRSLP